VVEKALLEVEEEEAEGGSGNNNWVSNSDEPPLPLFSTGNDPHDRSRSSGSSKNPRRRGLGGLPPLPPGGFTIYSASVRGRSPGRKYEMKMSQIKLPQVFKGDPSDNTLPYRKWFHSVGNYMK